jgi:hypothetical protein
MAILQVAGYTAGGELPSKSLCFSAAHPALKIVLSITQYHQIVKFFCKQREKGESCRGGFCRVHAQHIVGIHTAFDELNGPEKAFLAATDLAFLAATSLTFFAAFFFPFLD